MQTFDVSGEGLCEHVTGDEHCGEGWCGLGFPLRCTCGGLIHADFGDDSDEGYWCYEKCDQCGYNYERW